jgi:hypothetical protein
MSNTVRLVIAICGAMVLAALATPELSSKLPPGAAQLAAAVIAAVLHKMNDKALPEAPVSPGGQQ